MIGVTCHRLCKVQGAPQPWWPVASIVSGDVFCHPDTERTRTPQKSGCPQTPKDPTAQPTQATSWKEEQWENCLLYTEICHITTVQVTLLSWIIRWLTKKGLHKTEEPHPNPSDCAGGVGPEWLEVRSTLLVQHGHFFLLCLGRLLRVWPPPSTFHHILMTWDFREKSSQPSQVTCWLMWEFSFTQISPCLLIPLFPLSCQ